MKRIASEYIVMLLICCLGSGTLANDWMSGIDDYNKTFEATIYCSSTKPFQQSKDIIVKYDPLTTSYYGRVLSKVIKKNGEEKIWDDQYSQNSRQTSMSIKAFGASIKRIDIEKRAQNGSPEEGSVLRSLKIPYVKASYLPFHLVELDGMEYQLSLSKESIVGNNIKEFEYHIKVEDRYDLKVTYKVEFSDGIKILSSKLEEDGVVNVEVKNSNHKKQDGIWVAQDIDYKRYSDGKVIDDTKITIKDIAFGKVYKDETFVIKPEIGDDIYDNILGQRLIYGHGTVEMATENSLNMVPDLNSTENELISKKLNSSTKTAVNDLNKSSNPNQQKQKNIVDTNENPTEASIRNSNYPMILLGLMAVIVFVFFLLKNRLSKDVRKEDTHHV